MINRIALFVLIYLLLGVPGRLSAEKIVYVSAGQLQLLFDTNDLTYERDLTLKGAINGSDVKVLRIDQRTLSLHSDRKYQ